MNALTKALMDAQEHLRAARADAMELHVQIQETIEFINARQTRQDGYFHPADLQEVVQRLRALQKLLGAH